MFDPKTSILVVDSMLTMRKNLVKTLADLGFNNIVEADDGAKAWELIHNSSHGIQLVLSDWAMPKSTGMDLLKRIRSDSRANHLPFIFVTTENSSDKISEALRLGISGYIMKPLNIEKLREKLEAAHQKLMANYIKE